MRVAVQRFDPAQDQKPRWAVYEVALSARQTVLDGLLRIAEELDPTLAFRRMCRSGICGACGAVVNGRPVLMCQTLAGEAAGRRRLAAGDDAAAASAARGAAGADGAGGVWSGVASGGAEQADLVIEPLPHFRVLKDLVVDLEPFLTALERLHAWVVPRAGYDGRLPREVAQKLWGVAPCVLCGICAAVPGAPGASEMAVAAAAHPAALARALRVAFDPRDELGLLRLRLFGELGLLAPQVARFLREVCPKGVDIEPLVAGLTSAAQASA